MGLVICFALTGCHPFEASDEQDPEITQADIYRGKQPPLNKHLQGMCEFVIAR